MLRLERTYGPTHQTLESCRETHQPQVVQALAAHVRELQIENRKLHEILDNRAEVVPIVPPSERAPR